MTHVVVAGYGYWGANLARNVVAAKGVELAGVVDPSAEQREAAAATHPAIKIWDTFDSALEADDIDAVMLSTPAANTF